MMLPGFLPSLLLLRQKSRKVYCRLREPLIAFTFLSTLVCMIYFEHFIEALTERDFSRPMYLYGYSWLPVLILLFPLRIVVLVRLVLFCFALDLTLMPMICARNGCDPETFFACVKGNVLWLGALAIIMPLAGVWSVEKVARNVYLKKSAMQAFGQ